MSLTFTYPQELPVSASRSKIMEAVKSNQVVIVSGQTGSGKTTQIPKMLLELNRGTHGKQIMLTQPRRIAARTVAERIADEMQVRLGNEIGYRVRFTDESSASTRLCVATDGILLAQIQRDPNLSKYDTIMIDEAHERSLNIDFLLGYLSSLLPKRHDLKLIITSATIDSQKFQEHFSAVIHKQVPIIEVSGRTYPVQVVYEPLGGMPALMNSVPGFTNSNNFTNGNNLNALGNNTLDNTDTTGGTSESDNSDMDMSVAVARACMELVVRSSHEYGARDILVFAAGERDIRDYETALLRTFGARASDSRRPDAIEIIPLFARLSAKEQHRVFEPHDHQRIILATNVAETSLTVPGIRYVVDPGFARISRYSKTAKVQRLPIEPISQASANQRAGRCGRIADGIAIRLYSKEDYDAREEFTDPEILRTSLGAVVLHMLSVGVAHTAADVTSFGFIDPPDMRAVSDGFNELTELGAISRKRGEVRLTAVGKKLSRIPIDVRLGRMVVEAAHNTPNVLAAVLVIVAFLSLQDPRERPEDKREEADRIHNRYRDSSSDFLTALNIWDRFYQADGEPSNSALRKLCKAEFMSWIRMRQWRDLYQQLRAMCKEMKWTVGEPVPSSRAQFEIRQLPMAQQAAGSLACSWDSDSIHQSMLSGLLSSIGMQVIREPKASQFAGLSGAQRARAIKRAQKMSKNDYQGARGIHFSLFPASSTASSTPQWVMAGELVETSRLWACSAAAIDPQWAEKLAGSLVRTTYAEPHWSGAHGAAIASSNLLLYGLPIVQNRIVQWGKINPFEARQFLIRQGLVEGDIHQRFPYDAFVAANRAIIENADEETNRTRHIANAVNDEDLYQFYDSVIPEHITSIAALESWWKKEHNSQPKLLDFDIESVERLSIAESASLDDYPDSWRAAGSDGSDIDLKLSYVYDPHIDNDGVSVHVPISVLNRLRPGEFTWNVPGMLGELILGTIKSLPKALRVQFVPAPDTAVKIEDWINDRLDSDPDFNPQSLDFAHAFTKAAIAVTGAQIHPEVFNSEQTEKLPPYLRMTFVVEQKIPANTQHSKQHDHNHHRSHHGHQKMITKALGSSKNLTELQKRFAQEAQSSARARVERKAQSAEKQGKQVEKANLLNQSGASTISRQDMLWNAALETLRLPSERISSRWLGNEALMLTSAPYKSTKNLVEDIQRAAVKQLLPHVNQYNTDAQFEEAVLEVRNSYEDTVYSISQNVVAILREYAKVEKEVSGPADLPLLSVLQSIREHIATLVHPGFIGEATAEALPNIKRYIQADSVRLAKAKANKSRDVQWAWQADEAHQLVLDALKSAQSQPAGPSRDSAIATAEQARWMYEEFLVSLWAQELGTPKPVSLQRIKKLLNA